MLTVLVTTYNGAKTLPCVLAAYCQLEPPDGGWELIIVDNGSTDRTKEIISSFSQCLPVTYRFEPRRGQNAARNSALSSALGDLIAFTDDDVLPRPDWLRQIHSAANAQAAFSIFGGPILPKWESPPEEWILTWVPKGATFAILDSVEDGPIPTQSVFGPNMSIRASIFQRGYQFDETIGPDGSNRYPMGAETEFLIRLEKEGYKAWHCKCAVVSHMIRSFQMKKTWVLDRAFRFGRGQYRLALKTSPNSPVLLLGMPGYLVLRLVRCYLRVAKAGLKGDAEKLFKARWELNYALGQVFEARLIRRGQTISAIHQRAEHAP